MTPLCPECRLRPVDYRISPRNQLPEQPGYCRADYERLCCRAMREERHAKQKAMPPKEYFK